MSMLCYTKDAPSTAPKVTITPNRSEACPDVYPAEAPLLLVLLLADPEGVEPEVPLGLALPVLVVVPLLAPPRAAFTPPPPYGQALSLVEGGTVHTSPNAVPLINALISDNGTFDHNPEVAGSGTDMVTLMI
jgi:hypothetical protein